MSATTFRRLTRIVSTYFVMLCLVTYSYVTSRIEFVILQALSVYCPATFRRHSISAALLDTTSTFVASGITKLGVSWDHRNRLSLYQASLDLSAPSPFRLGHIIWWTVRKSNPLYRSASAAPYPYDSPYRITLTCSSTGQAIHSLEWRINLHHRLCVNIILYGLFGARHWNRTSSAIGHCFTGSLSLQG